MLSSKERRRALRSSRDPSWRGDTHNINSVNSSLEEWLLARNKIGEYSLLPILTLVDRFYKTHVSSVVKSNLIVNWMLRMRCLSSLHCIPIGQQIHVH
jgi:hypothetical protein